ncbi:MAG: hypothetical protein JXA46_12860 [Dehalococcoidales bacterium]|nr:hypothetical protein [Dehalococcoidales bacterium]
MFLFRKRRDEEISPADELKLEENIKPQKPAKAAKTIKPEKTARPAAQVKPVLKESKDKTTRKTGADEPVKDPFFQSGDSLQIMESDTPVKVVIPASSLVENDMEISEKEIEQEFGDGTIDEEAVDNLFEKVNEGKTLEEDDIELDAILPPDEKKADPKPAGKKPVSAEGKARPVKKDSPAPDIQAGSEDQAEVPILPFPELSQEVEEKVGYTSGESATAVANAAAASALASAASALASAASASSPAVEANGKTPIPAEDAAKKSGEDEKGKKDEEENKDNLFSQLFSKVEEVEETPLDRLIKSLPDISIEEVMNEAEEVKDMMSEWFQNQRE